VVILDGSAISRDLLNSVLTNGGHHVVGDSNTSPAALATMIKLRPQIVCVDTGQADADGMAILDTIRSELPNRSLKKTSIPSGFIDNQSKLIPRNPA
jgi:CheY-like chemotaxis protein